MHGDGPKSSSLGGACPGGEDAKSDVGEAEFLQDARIKV
jgi:hypothetical protein